MYIRKLKIKNFRSFYGEHEINFEELKGLYKVSGQIGSGKSTISMAILYGLFGSVNGQNQTDLISWNTKESTIEMDIESKGHSINIKRFIYPYGQCPLNVLIDGSPLESSNKRNLQQSFEDYLDVSRLSMELLCIISFNNFKSLSSMNTKEINDFQDQILGFSILNDYKDASKDFSKELKTLLIKLDNDINHNEKRIEELKNKPKKIEGNIKEEKDNLNKLLNELDEITKGYEDHIDEISNKLKTKKEQQSQTTYEGKRIAKEIDFIKKGVCPTCGKEIDQSKLPELENQRTFLQSLYKTTSTEIEEITNELNTMKSSLSSIKETKNEKINEIKTKIVQLELQEKYINDDAKELKNLLNDIKKLNSDYTENEKEQMMFDDLTKLFGEPMRSKLTSNYIIPINERCRQICSQSRLEFVPQFNEQFKCNIEKNGITIPVSSLSTGQSKMIDMICILAIISSIINSSRCNIIFLDELFSNLDSNAREIMLRVIPTIFPKDSTIMIVSHQELNEDLLSGCINLTLESGKSQISIDN